jgi:Tfp pilus assembly protein PilX
MRGVFFIVVLISLLVVGILVLKDMQSGSKEGVSKKEMVKKAERTVDSAEEAMKRLNERIVDSQ